MHSTTSTTAAYFFRKASRLVLSFVLAGLWAHNAQAGLPPLEPLRFALVPPAAGGPACDLHGQPAASETKGRQAGKRPEQGRAGGGGRPPQRFESEHRPVPVRTYFLNASGGESQVTVSILHPDGTGESLPVEQDKESKVTVKLPMADGPAHGAHNVYAVEQKLSGETLLVRSAKWLFIHHSCGWGHDWKFDRERQTPRSNPEIPLEIVVDGLWDPNFHSNVMSGDDLQVRVLAHGKPAAGARLTVHSEKGWQKTMVADQDGRATVQLIRDYYPGVWMDFDRTKQGEILFTGEYDEEIQGDYNGLPFNRIKHVATFPWRYVPARTDYSSYEYGLLTALAGLLLSGFGFAFHRRGRSRGIRKQPWN